MNETALNVRADPLAKARLQWLLRFGVGVSATYVLGEALGWSPAYLAPLFAAMLMSHLPGSPPLKVGLVLMAVVAVATTFGFFMSTSLLGTPAILFG